MERKGKIADASGCIHCHACQKSCGFLKKYGIDIGDVDRLRGLAYHCFLCGMCICVCPKGIDGREIVRGMRREQAQADKGAFVRRNYRRTVSEKQDYLYRNYRHAAGKSVLFPGCNFPSLYPRTTKRLAALLGEKAGIGIVYDCCGKPMSDLGMREQEERIVREIEERLREASVEEIVTVCPNCYEYLKPRVTVRVSNIYEKLCELGIGEKIPGGAGVFTPCPDREEHVWLSDIEAFMDEKCEVIRGIQCCGLGGHGAAMEPEIAGSFSERLKGNTGTLYTYCGSCVGQLSRNGVKGVLHVLPEILGTHEKPDTVKSLINRMRTKHL